MAEAGSAAKARLERVLDELTDLEKRARFIEIETTEKLGDMAELKSMDASAKAEFEREIQAMMDADDEHLFWTFRWRILAGRVGLLLVLSDVPVRSLSRTGSCREPRRNGKADEKSAGGRIGGRTRCAHVPLRRHGW